MYFDSYVGKILYGIAFFAAGIYGAWKFGTEHIQVLIDGKTVSAEITGKTGHTVREPRWAKGNWFKTENELFRHHWRYRLGTATLVFVDSTESYDVGDVIDVTYSTKDHRIAMVGNKSTAIFLVSFLALVVAVFATIGIASIRSGFRQWSQSI